MKLFLNHDRSLFLDLVFFGPGVASIIAPPPPTSHPCSPPPSPPSRVCVCLYVNQALQFLSKAHRCEMQASGWEKDTGTFKEVIRRAIDMGTGEDPQIGRASCRERV